MAGTVAMFVWWRVLPNTVEIKPPEAQPEPPVKDGLVTIRISPELLEQARSIAVAEDRSLASLVVHHVRQGVARDRQSNPTP